MKGSSLFYLFLVNFKVCRPKEEIRMVIRRNRRKDFLLSFVYYCFEMLCVGVLKADTLIGHCILLKKALNKKLVELYILLLHFFGACLFTT